ncbi:MAG: hypothetical protein K2Q06_05700 [Parvularculaceae bacterium]|nr:hypothetical protein [Parvularculaceae bacterium]
MTRALNDVIDGLLAILGEEKSALLAGDFAKVGSMAAEKDRRASELDRLLTDAETARAASAFRRRLSEIARAASENEKLLDAARNGVMSARARLKDVVYRERNIGAYAETGAKIVSDEAGVTRRKTA